MERIGELRIEGQVLEGLRGRLWLGVDEGSGQHLAVHLATPGAPGPVFAAPGTGAHLAPVLTSGELGDGIPWFATTWFDGSLETLLRDEAPEPLAVERAVTILEQLLAALAAAGQAHLGLEPRVVRLDADGAVHLIGFGVGPSVEALARDPASGDPATAMIRACRAPELDAMGARVDGRADLHAVAVIAHRLLTGTLPQAAEPDADLMVDRILSGRTIAAPWVPPTRLNRALPLPLGEWILEGLAQDPDARFADAQTMRAALLEITADARRQAGTPEKAADAPPPEPVDLPETIEALIDAARVAPRQRETLRTLAAAVRTDAADPGEHRVDQTRAALREAARAAGMDVEHLDALLLGRYRPRRAAGAKRPRPQPAPTAPEPAVEPERVREDPPEARTPRAPGPQRGFRNSTLAGVAAGIAALLVLGLLLGSGDSAEEAPSEQLADAPRGAGTTPTSDESAPLMEAGTLLRDTLASGGEGPELIVVPAGSYRMGCVSRLRCAPDELPVREVGIPRALAVGVHEVTFEAYDRFAAETGRVRPGDERWGRGRHPAINVSWDEARAYLAWLSDETGERYRLPTEAEWEYFARAGSETPWFFGTDPKALCTHGNGADALTNYDRRNDACNDGVGRRTAEVGSYRPNAFGLHDTLGNLWEWVEDCYVGSYEGAPTDGTARAVEGTCPTRTLRGGGLNSGPDGLRSANRERNSPTLSLYYIGFRVVREL